MESASHRPPTDHLTVAERAAHGKSLRATVPRTSLGEWAPGPDRVDPVALLEQQAQARVPDLVPIRYGRMAASPFAFFRGAALPMAADLATTACVPLRVQLCGDAHLANFGGFAAPDRSMVFDLNDFDETTPGPFDWDLKRLAASFEVAGRGMGLDGAGRRTVVETAARTYRTAMIDFAGQTNLDVWYARLDLETLAAEVGERAGRAAMKRMQRNIDKAKSKDRLKAAAKLTRRVGDRIEFVSDPPLLVPVAELFSDADSAEIDATVHDAIRSYRRSLPGDRRHLLETYQYVEVARKVVGVGSVGTRAWVVLFMGRDDADPLFLQVKEAQASVLESFVGKSQYANHGQRVVEGQRLMQAAGDIFLGFMPVTGADGVTRDFYMRQLWDWKASADVESMDPVALGVYAQICGWTLARAHARSGDRVAIAAYLGKGTTFDGAIADFAAAYAEQNDLDHRELVQAIEQGRVVAQSGI